MSLDGHKPHLFCRQPVAYSPGHKKETGRTMARVIETRFICDGRYRVLSINAVGRHRARIIEIEDVDLRERFHGSASKLDRMVLTLLGQAYRDRRDNSKRRAR
jgi:hypothetical protein